MAFQAKDGKKFNSKFRMSRYDASKGPRSQANQLEGKPAADSKGPDQSGPSHGAAEGASAGATQKASDVHITHDHEANHHHVKATGHDGEVMHDQDYPSADEAHKAGAKMAGAAYPETNEDEGNYPEGHEQPETEYPDADDFAPSIM